MLTFDWDIMKQPRGTSWQRTKLIDIALHSEWSWENYVGRYRLDRGGIRSDLGRMKAIVVGMRVNNRRSCVYCNSSILLSY